MRKLNSGRTLYYGKGDVLTYRTYAKPLSVGPIAESAYDGDVNVIFAHNIKFAVGAETLLTSFTEGDNAHVVATDSMKNFILRNASSYEGSTTEGLLAYISDRFLEKYPHITAIDIEATRIPFSRVQVAGADGFEPSKLVYRPSHNEKAHARLEFERSEAGGEARIVGHRSGVADLQLIKVSGSSFFGFVRDEYTTLPESFDRPLFIYLNVNWTYGDPTDAFGGDKYVAAEQVRDIAHHVFHEFNTPSIQYLIYRIGLRVLERFPQLEQVFFESNNRTWETIVDPEGVGKPGVYTEPRPPYGFQGFTVSRDDLAEAGSA
ncbi:factor-independent urate hydroxylase [Cohnella suwonensis]|uniref:Uricase n=1 Tax=Cohnella suwonensis TaxID=696072 RepID=A0ABW0M333_9BACL